MIHTTNEREVMEAIGFRQLEWERLKRQAKTNPVRYGNPGVFSMLLGKLASATPIPNGRGYSLKIINQANEPIPKHFGRSDIPLEDSIDQEVILSEFELGDTVAQTLHFQYGQASTAYQKE